MGEIGEVSEWEGVRVSERERVSESESESE